MNYYRVEFEFHGVVEVGYYSADSKEAVRAFLRECGVSEKEIKGIVLLARYPIGRAIEEI